MNPFSSLGLGQEIVSALIEQGYENPTPIQAAAIPKALAGHDLLAAAQTGTGKTAAFMLPSLERLKRFATASTSPAMHPVRMLVLTPTRELADQIDQNTAAYIKNLPLRHTVLFGGMNMDKQTADLRAGCEIVVATVGRLLDHVQQKNIRLDKVEIVVLDEADRMLDMGFADDLGAIIDALPENRQTIMSSATWDGAVGKIAARYTREPERISIKVESAHIEEKVYFCDDQGHKNRILEHLVTDPDMGQTIIFAATKRSSEEIADSLRDNGHRARFLHGDLPQVKRNRIVEDLRKGKCDILVATDVAARGIDIPAISHVINYDLPRQVEDYVHRIGRSGRAGRSGVAINLCSLADRSQLSAITRYLERKIDEHRIEGMEPKITSKPKTKPSKKFRGNPSKGYGKKFDDKKSWSGKKGGKPFAHKGGKPFTARKDGGKNFRKQHAST